MSNLRDRLIDWRRTATWEGELLGDNADKELDEVWVEVPLLKI